MRYNELIENDDDDMFGSSERVDRDLRRATFAANMPNMIRYVQQGLLRDADRQARKLANEFFREANFLEKEELYPLAREVFTHEAPQHLHQAFAIVSEDPAIIEDEDRLSDTLMSNNIFTDIRNDSDLWVYATDMMVDFDEGDGDLEYHLAMEIEGTVGNLIVQLMQQAFASVRSLGEDTDDELFSKVRERPVNRFTIYVNNRPLRTMIDLEQAAGAAEDLINQETRRVNVQVVNAVDGEILWSGGTDRMGKWHGAYEVYLEETEDDDDLFSNRPNGKVIAHDLELWLRRRQSGSRRPLSAYSADAITEIITAFNKSFAAGVQAWDVAPIIADLKYDIREYIGSSQHIDIADHVQEINEAPLADYQPLGDFNKPGPFRGADKRLVPHPTNQLKAARFFEQTPYDFRLFFSNISGTGKYSEYGAMDPDVVKIVFGDSDAGEQIVQGHENAITIVFVGNKGDSKVMLTPWMMAHRIGHAIQATGRMRQSEGPWKAAEDHFFRAINGLLDGFYGRRGNPGGQLKNELRNEYNALFNAIGTQRSSRTGQITRPYEFLYELFAQYLGTGRITLNPLPKQQAYGRKAWGRSTQSLRLRGDEEESKYTTEVLARDMELMFDDVLSSMVGKILVM